MANVDLCVFASTKARYGRANDYRATVNILNGQIDDFHFNNRFLSLKTFAGEELRASEIKSFFKDYFVLEQLGADVNRDNRGQLIGGILKDICIFVDSIRDYCSDYLFFVEDDSPIVCNESFGDLIDQSIKELENDKNLLSIHFPRLSINHLPCSIPEWYKYHNLVAENGIIRNEYFFNFQNRLVRLSDFVNAMEFLFEEAAKAYHPEEAMKNAFLRYNPNFKWWAWAPGRAFSLHLGEETENHNKLLEFYPWVSQYYN